MNENYGVKNPKWLDDTLARDFGTQIPDTVVVTTKNEIPDMVEFQTGNINGKDTLDKLMKKVIVDWNYEYLIYDGKVTDAYVVLTLVDAKGNRLNVTVQADPEANAGGFLDAREWKVGNNE